MNKYGPIEIGPRIAFRSRVKNAGNQICQWWNAINEGKSPGHWDQNGYKQGLRDALEILKRHHVIEDYSVINGVTMEKKGD